MARPMLGKTIGRLVLAVLAAACGIVVIRRAPADAAPALSYAFGVFCLMIALACITRGRVAQFFGSVVGIVVCAMAVHDLVSACLSGPTLFARSGEPSLLGAVLFMVCFGWPAAAYVWRARFGLRAAAAGG